MIKQTILNLLYKVPFIKISIDLALSEARKQGGVEAFPLAQKDILETMRDDLDKQAGELAQKKLRDLLMPINMDMVVTLNRQRGLVYIGGELADDARLANLKSEAEFLLQSDLWKVIYESLNNIAQKTMFVSSEGLDDMKKGKSILFTLDTQKNMLETFKSYQKKE